MKRICWLGVLALALASGASATALNALTISSAAFVEGRPIPARFSCAGADVSPPLRWTGAPAATKTFALVCDDPDAPGRLWVHWVLYNLPAGESTLPEAVATTELLPNGAVQGLNNFRRVGYGGPCPPPGETHRYYFRLYALDTVLPLKPRATQAELLRAMQGHILAQAQTMGTFTAR